MRVVGRSNAELKIITCREQNPTWERLSPTLPVIRQRKRPVLRQKYIFG